jgi:hypothetical protein
MTHITTHPERRSNRAAVWLSWRSCATAVLLCALTWFGHRLVFARFQDYDDEGYLLVTVQQFLQGLPLYDQVYTQYGPAYHLWQQVLHTLLGIPVTHDATRVVTLVVWLTCAVLVGWIVWLLTKRQLLTALGTIAAFMHLTRMTLEPGHPQELCMLGVLGALALTTWRLAAKTRIGPAASMGVWALVAVTALTKVNVGAFLAGALTLGLVTSLIRTGWRTKLEGIVIAAAMLAVPALMRVDLRRSDIAAYMVVVWCGLLAAFISRSSDADEEGVVTVWDLVAGVSAFAIACGVLVAGILYQGTSPRALFEGLFVAPLLLPKVFWSPLPVPALLAAVAPATLLAAWCWHRGLIRQRWIEFAALACGLIVSMLSVAKVYWALFAVGPLLAWLVLSDRAVGVEHRAARRILAFAAIFMGLQAYPMPGSQIVLGTVLYVPLALVMIAGVQRTLSARERSSPAVQPSFGWRALLALLAVAAVVVLGMQAQRFYARGVSLDLPGARSLRTTERNVATYRWLNANMRENCDAFITAPGLNSLHFWTEMAPVSTLNTTVWPVLFDHDQQRRIVAVAERVERLCVAWSPLRMESPPEIAARPLMAWLLREFEPRGRFGEWEFRMRRDTPANLVYEGRWVQGGDLVLALPSIDRDAVARIAVVDVDVDRTLGDSARSEEIVVLDEQGARLRVDRGIDVSKPRRITLRPAVPAASSSNGHSVVVRLWARDGRSLAIVPIVSAPARVVSPHVSSTRAGRS